MKNIIRILLLSALIFMMGMIVAYAQGPSGTFASGIACVNLTNSQGSFIITFYDTNGAVKATISDTINPNGVKLYFTPSATYTTGNLDPSFFGSAVVSSDVNMACSVNTQTTSGDLRIATSNGQATSQTSTKIFATQILNDLGGFSSYVAVQNAGTSSTNVTAKYFDSTGALVFTSSPISLPANSSTVFYQDDGNLPPSFIGSATFESDGEPLAGTVALFNAGTNAGNSQLLGYNTFTSGSTSIIAPRIAKNLSFVGFTSGFACQNVGTVQTDVTADFTVTDQSTTSQVSAQLVKTGLQPGQSWLIYMGNTGNSTLDNLVAFFGNAIFTSTASDIACTFNEDNRTNFAGMGSTYSGIPVGNATTTVFFPQIVSLGSNSFQGGFQISNTTANATTCTYNFSNGDVISNVPLLANGSNSVFAPNTLLNDINSFNGSAIVTCGEPIVGIYNFAGFSIPGDAFVTNNGINQ